MIDSREYNTTEELEQAMEFEKNCCELKTIKGLIFQMEAAVEETLSKIRTLKIRKNELEKSIDIFLKNNTDKTIIKERD